MTFRRNPFERVTINSILSVIYSLLVIAYLFFDGLNFNNLVNIFYVSVLLLGIKLSYSAIKNHRHLELLIVYLLIIAIIITYVLI